jgi:hypothetical protein
MIETTLKELTTAIRELTVALNNRSTTTTVVPEPKPASVTVAPTLTPTPTATPTATPTPTPEPTQPVEAKVTIPAGKVTQADLRDAASQLLMAKRLPDILAINQQFGIKRITECPEDKYEQVFAALNAALANAKGS